MGNSFFDVVLTHPIINLLVFIYHLLLAVNIPYALGFSIIVLTILIKVILYPLTSSQLRASKKMQELSPHLSSLKEKHKSDAKRLQEETMRLYKEHNVNPAAGCIPLLVQLPILWALYPLLSKIISLPSSEVVSVINKVLYFPSLYLRSPWDPYFLGISLGKNPSQLFSMIPAIMLIPVITGILQYLQSKMLFASPPLQTTQSLPKKNDDFASAFQTQSLYIFPIMIGFFSYSLPVGLSLYWNTMTIFGILQQYHILGLGGLQDLFKRK